jgi:hypothetical protein
MAQRGGLRATLCAGGDAKLARLRAWCGPASELDDAWGAFVMRRCYLVRGIAQSPLAEDARAEGLAVRVSDEALRDRPKRRAGRHPVPATTAGTSSRLIGRRGRGGLGATNLLDFRAELSTMRRTPCRTAIALLDAFLHPERASAPPTSLDRQRWHDDVARTGQQ